jgi:hypothetical protein
MFFKISQEILHITGHFLSQTNLVKTKIGLLLKLKISPKLVHVLLSIHFHSDTSHFSHIQEKFR